MNGNSLWILLAVVAVMAVVAVVALSLHNRQPLSDTQRRRPAREPRGTAHDETVGEVPADRPVAAIIINPTKFDRLEQVQQQITRVCVRNQWAEPLFIETTQDDPGAGQARDAVERGADLVCPLGGDGTVRAVASGLAGTDTPMGLLPGGTGNLLARNLGLPVDSLDDALEIALTGADRRIDVGRMQVRVTPDDEAPDDEVPPAPGEPKPVEEDEPPTEHLFLVMAGIGFDANVMEDAPEQLKNTMGWPAYVVSAAKHLNGSRFRALLSVDGSEMSRRVRSVLIGNVGELQGGIRLMPDARADDGMLDAVVMSPEGVVGWAAVAGSVLSRQRWGHERLEHVSGKEFRLRTDEAQQVQLDGDGIGRAESLRVWVDPGQLTVRVAH